MNFYLFIPDLEQLLMGWSDTNVHEEQTFLINVKHILDWLLLFTIAYSDYRWRVMIIDEELTVCSDGAIYPKNSVYMKYLEGQLDLDIVCYQKDMRAEIVSELGLELLKLTPMDLCY